MDVTPLVKDNAQIIQSYSGGQFRISGIVYEAAVIVTPERSFAWDGVPDFEGLSVDAFAPLTRMANDVDVVLLGCGPRMQFLDLAFKAALKERGLSVDVMDTGAACRTYNVLMAEGRRVAAALFPA